MEQGKLPLTIHNRRSGEQVSLEAIARRDTLTKAIVFAFEVGSIPDSLVCAELDIDSATYSKIKSGTRHFPPDKIGQAMDLAGNEIPLQWLAHRRGYGLVRLQSELEKENEQLRRQLAEQSQKLEHFREFITLGKQ